MPDTPRQLIVRASAAALAAAAGPASAAYALALDLGDAFRWVLGSASTPDNVAVLGYTGGNVGAWHRIRRPRLGDNLTNADATIQVGGKEIRRLPATTLTGNHTLTLGTTNAAAGDVLRIVRIDAEAFTYALVNGGAGAGTLITMPISVRYWAEVYFDGTNWLLIGAGQMAT